MPPSRDNVNERFASAIRTMLGLIFVATTRVAVDPGSAAAEGSSDTTVAVAGALLGDFVFLSMETDRITGVNAQVMAFVSAADTVTVHVSNGNVAAGAAIDIASTTCQITIIRRA